MAIWTVLALLACTGTPGGGDDTADTSDTATADDDDDGLPDADETANGCDDEDADSDDDGLLDGAEVSAGTDCANPDSDGDDLCDGVRHDDDADGISPASECNLSEAWFGCNATAADTDGGGTPDGIEALRLGTDCASDDDVGECVPNFDLETWDLGIAHGFVAETGLTLSESDDAHGGESSASLSWSGTAPVDFVFAEPLSSAQPNGTNCVFRAWVDESDPNASAVAGVRVVEPASGGGWTTLTEYFGGFGSIDGGWQETVVEFPCTGAWQPVLRMSSVGSGGTVRTDDWVVHVADHDPFVLWDSETDARAIQLTGPDGPVDIEVRLQSTSIFEGVLYVSAPWASANADRGILVYGGEPNGTATPPWSKAGSIPDANGRLLALMQEGSDPSTQQWRCEWLEWAAFGPTVWTALAPICSGGQSQTPGARLEGTFAFSGSGSTPWPEQFWFAVGQWGSQDNGTLSDQIPEGDGDSTLEAGEVLGPFDRTDLYGNLIKPCAGLGDANACPGLGAVGTSTCAGNLLEDGGFEADDYGNGVPDEPGGWGGDLAAIEDVALCRRPTEGNAWLRFDGTDVFGASADDRADVIQLLDAGPYRGDTLALSAEFVRALGAGDAFHGVEVRLYDGVPDDFPVAWARGDGTVLGGAGARPAEVAGTPWASARPEVEVAVPAGDADAYLAVIVFALEDTENDDQSPEFAEAYVDDVCLVRR